jgi:hypothetical protein
VTDDLLERMTPEERVEFRRRARYWLIGGAFLIICIGFFVGYVVHEDRADLNDRIVARYILCKEMEALKAAERKTLSERIEDNEVFLAANPQGLPTIGISAAQIRRSIRRDTTLLEALAPYPKGCASFARDPDNLDVEVPELPK